MNRDTACVLLLQQLLPLLPLLYHMNFCSCLVARPQPAHRCLLPPMQKHV